MFNEIVAIWRGKEIPSLHEKEAADREREVSTHRERAALQGRVRPPIIWALAPVARNPSQTLGGSYGEGQAHLHLP